MKKRFDWDLWDFDGGGKAYIVAKSACKDSAEVPGYICTHDLLDGTVADVMEVESGWCKWQCRSDWDDMSGPHGAYVVTVDKSEAVHASGKIRSGWFPVWIVRIGDCIRRWI